MSNRAVDQVTESNSLLSKHFCCENECDGTGDEELPSRHRWSSGPSAPLRPSASGSTEVLLVPAPLRHLHAFKQHMQVSPRRATA